MIPSNIKGMKPGAMKYCGKVRNKLPRTLKFNDFPRLNIFKAKEGMMGKK